MQTGHAHVVRRHYTNPELLQDGPGFLRQRDVARPRGDDRHHPRAVGHPEGSLQADDPTVRQLPGGEVFAGRSGDRPALGRRGPGDQGPHPGLMKLVKDREEMVGGLALAEDDLGHAHPPRAVPVHARDAADREFPGAPPPGRGCCVPPHAPRDRL